MLLRLLADRGHDSAEAKQRAFSAGVGLFGRWAGDGVFEPVTVDGVTRFEQSLDVLGRMNAAATRTLLQAITATVAQDGRVSMAEAEMIRAICASLGCPLPPMLAENMAGTEP